MPQKNLCKGFDRFAKKLSTTPTQSCIQKEACPGSGSTKASFFNLEKPKSMQKTNFFQGDRLQRTLHENQDLPKSLVAFCNHYLYQVKAAPVLRPIFLSL